MSTSRFVCGLVINAFIAFSLIEVDYCLTEDAGNYAYDHRQFVQYWAFIALLYALTALPCMKTFELWNSFDGTMPCVNTGFKIAMPAFAFAVITVSSSIQLMCENEDTYSSTGGASTLIWYGLWYTSALFFAVVAIKRARGFQRIVQVAKPAHVCSGDSCRM